MARQQSLTAKLARVHELRHQPPSPQLLQELRAHVRDPLNLVAADAAELVGELHLSDLIPDLIEAFEHFLDDPVKTDKLCRAKSAIVEALNKLEYTDEDFYLRSVHYEQIEPGYPESHDAAVPVRVGSAFGLVRNRHRGVLAILVDMLTDKDKAARVGAVQALAYTGKEDAAHLLRLKVRLGDKESEVISECFTGILELTPKEGLSFVTEYLNSLDETLAEAALLALGSSRLPEAFPILKSFAEKHLDESQEVAYVALALLRLPAATDFLLSLVAGQPKATALSALAALAVNRHDPRLRERVAAAVETNGTSAVRVLFEKKFGRVSECQESFSGTVPVPVPTQADEHDGPSSSRCRVQAAVFWRFPQGTFQ